MIFAEVCAKLGSCVIQRLSDDKSFLESLLCDSGASLSFSRSNNNNCAEWLLKGDMINIIKAHDMLQNWLINIPEQEIDLILIAEDCGSNATLYGK